MDSVHRIPVRIVPSAQGTDLKKKGESDFLPAANPRVEVEGMNSNASVVGAQRVDSGEETTYDRQENSPEAGDWKDHALRLQAEQANYRRRQQRLAQERIEEERQRLLRGFLPVLDNLERALDTPGGADGALIQGVILTRQAAVQMLEKEGVTPLPGEGQPFDPNWHEAIATTGVNGSNVKAGTIVRVVETGYRMGEHLLRPAKVIVAV